MLPQLREQQRLFHAPCLPLDTLQQFAGTAPPPPFRVEDAQKHGAAQHSKRLTVRKLAETPADDAQRRRSVGAHAQQLAGHLSLPLLTQLDYGGEARPPLPPPPAAGLPHRTCSSRTAR